jgi:hypothetical protein
MDVIRVLLILVGLLVGGSVVVTGGLLIFLISFIRSAKKNPELTALLERAFDRLYASQPASKEAAQETAELLKEGGDYLGELTDGIPASEKTPPETGQVG